MVHTGESPDHTIIVSSSFRWIGLSSTFIDSPSGTHGRLGALKTDHTDELYNKRDRAITARSVCRHPYPYRTSRCISHATASLRAIPHNQKSILDNHPDGYCIPFWFV